MAKNDVLLLDGIIDDRVENELPSSRRDEVFEYLAFEQLLKGYDLSQEEILYGSIDGRNDGGIDGFYVFVNGHLLLDAESFSWPKSGALLEVWIVTCKHHDTFKQGPLDNLVATLSEILDLSICADDFQGEYSDGLIAFRELLKLAYRKLSPKLSGFKVSYVYASRGDGAHVGESIISRADQIIHLTKESFGSCEVDFDFTGSTELVELHRKIPNFSLELPFAEVLSSGERYVLLANLADYYSFISDEGKLRRYLFDSNVRDFMGLNRVNEGIKSTLEDDDSPDFWCLNNGVTILATSASVVGDFIKLEDIQIVNGLQTTESIFRYFEAGGQDKNNRSLLIKIIVSQDDSVRDSIIRATNNQTEVGLSALHATDKIQRDIEDIFDESGYFYERRRNFHKNLGNPYSKIISPLYLASGYVSLILKSPFRASYLKSRFMRSEEFYNKVFSEKATLSVYPAIVVVLKTTDHFLERVRPKKGSGGERFLKRWRQVISLITVARLLGRYDFSDLELSRFDLKNYTDDEVNKTWCFIISKYPNDVAAKNIRSRKYYAKLCEDAAEEFSIENYLRVEKWNDFGSSGSAQGENVVDLGFAKKVNQFLPPQPWKKGTHREIIEQLGCTSREYTQSVQILIDEGLRNKQVDGIVFDHDGNVVAFDQERVDPETLKLFGD